MGNIFEDRQIIENREVMKKFYACIEIIFRHYLKEISEQIQIYKAMESAGVLDDLPNPLKTKEKKRYSDLKKDSTVLKNYLGEE